MPTISWDEGKPAGADSLGIGDDQIRSDKTAIRTAIDTEHVFPSGGGDAGVHRLGSARAHYAIQSLVSSSGTDGRLMQTSDTSQFFHVGSAGTSLIGGATVISAGSYPGNVPQRAYWAMEFGEGKTASGVVQVTYPNSGYSGRPFVQVTPKLTTETTACILWIDSVGATSFMVQSRLTNGATTSSHSFYWQSIGTRTL